jgi:hypothetical protein
LGVAAAAPLHAGDKEILISDLAAACGRPIDLIDLQTAGLPILTEILTTGTVIHRSDELLHAALVRRMIFDNEDFGRYRRRILAERRAQWIAE